MGGMQAFQWLVSYPEFIDRVVPIVGTPQPTSYDLLFWNMLMMALENDPGWRGGNYTKNPNLALIKLLVELNLSTPEFRVEHTSRTEFPKYMSDAEHGDSDDFDANDRYQQLRSLIAFDLARGDQSSICRSEGESEGVCHIVVARSKCEPGASVEFCQNDRSADACA
jgi:homoserine O-acetyltransferase/O-succinyltransferase